MKDLTIDQIRQVPYAAFFEFPRLIYVPGPEASQKDLKEIQGSSGGCFYFWPSMNQALEEDLHLLGAELGWHYKGKCRCKFCRPWWAKFL